MALARQGKEKEAIGRLTESLRHDPNNPDAHYELGVLILKRGGAALALPQFTAATRGRPSDADAYYQAAHCERMLGKPVEAVAAFREALRLRPDWPEATNDLAWMLATDPDPAVRNPSEAAALAASALRRSRSVEPELLDSVAAAQADQGKFDDALRSEQQAVELARSLGNARLTAELNEHAKAFARHQPVVEDPARHRASAPADAATQPAHAAR